jgi:putative spermidine/putrescine transport system substrate-binding protein
MTYWRRHLNDFIALCVVASFLLSGCSAVVVNSVTQFTATPPATPTSPPSTSTPTLLPSSTATLPPATATFTPTQPEPTQNPMLAMAAACKDEGMLTIIATPADWVNYGEIMDAFKSMYGVQINSLDENAGSADELAAIEANIGTNGPEAPDIIDVGYAYGEIAKASGDLQSYKVTTWDKIPDTLMGIQAKDPEGYWTGGYYGVMAFEVNTDFVDNVPQNWSDLLKPEYKGQVALYGNPLTSNQAIQAVFASALANGGSLDNAQPGLDFFAELNDAGNFIPLVAKASTILKGITPIVPAWDYLAYLNSNFEDETSPITVVYPSPTIASIYVQGISAYAPHPNCAKLWMELLHSDEGQLAWMRGYAHGVQQADLETRGVVPPDLAKKIPRTSDFSSALIPSPNQLSAARNLIIDGWMKTVGVEVSTPVP